ncbi:MAG: hypothetical protein ACLTH3_09240 [Lachnospira sp.]
MGALDNNDKHRNGKNHIGCRYMRPTAALDFNYTGTAVNEHAFEDGVSNGVVDGTIPDRAVNVTCSGQAYDQRNSRLYV